jgi:hypothetical protein
MIRFFDITQHEYSFLHSTYRLNVQKGISTALSQHERNIIRVYYSTQDIPSANHKKGTRLLRPSIGRSFPTRRRFGILVNKPNGA